MGWVAASCATRTRDEGPGTVARRGASAAAQPLPSCPGPACPWCLIIPIRQPIQRPFQRPTLPPALPHACAPPRSERVLALTGEIIADLNSSNYSVWEWRWRCVQVRPRPAVPTPRPWTRS